MGREIRHVPADWLHPKNEKGYIPLLDEPYAVRADKWLKDLADWEADTDGKRTEAMEKYQTRYFWDWDGGPPDEDSHRKRDWTEEEATAVQLYETVSEGTPLSPPFINPDELVAWLVEHGDYYGKRWTREQAQHMIENEWAPSMIMGPGIGIVPGYVAGPLLKDGA